MKASGARRIGHVSIEVGRGEEAVGRILGSVARREPTVWGFCNAHTVNVAGRYPEFRAALEQMTLFNDGVGVDIASRLLWGTPFPDNLNGTDLTPRVLEGLTDTMPIFLLGSPPGVAEIAADIIERRFPKVRIVGTQHGYFDRNAEPALAGRIAASGARLVLVGMGHPAQELWAARNVAAIGVPLLCVGAFLDFTAGRVSRAPHGIRRLRLEWAYRLLLEPRRLAARYLIGNGIFLLAVARQRMFG